MSRIPDTSGMTSLKVDNLSYRTGTEELRSVFEKYGEIGDLFIPRDRVTRESRGFGFVRFYDKRDAEEALDRLDGHNIDGRDIRVSKAMHPRPPQRFDDRRGGGGGYGDRRRRSYSRSRSRSPARRGRRSRSGSREKRESPRRSRSNSRGRDRSPARSGDDASPRERRRSRD